MTNRTDMEEPNLSTIDPSYCETSTSLELSVHQTDVILLAFQVSSHTWQAFFAAGSSFLLFEEIQIDAFVEFSR